MTEKQTFTDNELNICKRFSEDIGLPLSENQVKQFELFYELLIEKNKVMNLTAITDFDEVLLKHFIDSSIIYKEILENNVDSIMDVGTGAGFPGIPLKIIFPDVKITLLDSLNKRINFLNEVVDKLELVNIECLHGRAEDIAHKKEYREKYDLVVSRAVANLSTLSEYCIPFTKVGGRFLSYKSGNIDEELISAEHAIHSLNSEMEQVKKYTLPGSDIQRSLIIIRKTGKLNNKYPRKAGTPAKQPL